MNLNINTIQDHIIHLDYFERVLASCINDQSEATSIPTYNIDFELLCPILFKLPPYTPKHFLKQCKPFVERLLDSPPPKELYNLVISGAGFLEFLDQMYHLYNSLEHTVPMFLTNHRKNILFQHGYMSSQQLQHDLSSFSKAGYKATIQQPVQRFKDLLNNGVIHGIGDYFEAPSSQENASMKDTFDSLVENQCQYRGRRQTRLLHYKIDAINICLSIHYAQREHPPMLLLTTTDFNLTNCIYTNKDNHDNTLARLDRVPLFLKNTHNLEEIFYIDSSEDFLYDALSIASNLKTRIGQYHDINDVPPQLIKKLQSFYDDYTAYLNSIVKIQEETVDESIIDEIIDTISSDSKITNVLESAKHEVRQGGKEIVDKYIKDIDLSYFESFGLDQDPIVKKIKARLGIDF